MINKLDILIKNGAIIDGTGNPRYYADIGIADKKIVIIRRAINQFEAELVIDAEGKTVCPGFIDTHAHDGAYLLINPRCDEKAHQGVTTVVIGNCGFSLAPLSDKHREDSKKFLTIMGANYLPDDFWDISSFDEFLTRLENKNLGINVVPLVGHGTIRMAALGFENRQPTEHELATMKQLTMEAMQAGAFGLSSGLIYVPANYAKTEEIIELAKVAAQFNGIYATHMRSETDHQMAAINETLKIGEEAGIAVHISHHKIAGKQNWGQSKDTLKLFAKARENGMDVTCDQYPYPAGSTYLAAALPPHFQAMGPEKFAEKLKDADVRLSIIDEIENSNDASWENLIKSAGFNNLIISIAPRHEQYIGKSIARIAEVESKNPYDVFFDLLIREQMEAAIIIFLMEEKDIIRIMKDPLTMFGTDGIPDLNKNKDHPSKIHPRMTGTFPRILGRYVRGKKVISLEQAIRKMTSLPAQTFGLYQKGILRPGLDADIVIFDADKIIDMSTFEDAMQPPRGIYQVIVNGELSVENGKITGSAPGKVLRQR